MKFFTNFAKWTTDICKKDPAVVILNVGTCIGLYGFSTSDPMTLRSCSMTAGVSSIIFNLTRQPHPLYIPCYWSSAFFLANAYNINKLLQERSTVEMTEDEENIYAKHFLPSGLRPRQFIRLLDASKLLVFSEGQVLTTQGKPDERIFLLLKGKLDVIIDKQCVSSLSSEDSMCFIGEVSLLKYDNEQEFCSSVAELSKNLKHQHHQMTINSEIKQNSTIVSSATVIVPNNETVHVLMWEKRFILDLLHEHSEISNKLRALLLSTVLLKLAKKNRENTKNTYYVLLKACLSGGEISALEKKALRSYRAENEIDDSYHIQCLLNCNWTEEEFIDGIKDDGSQTPIANKISSIMNKKLSPIAVDGPVNVPVDQREVNTVLK